MFTKLVFAAVFVVPVPPSVFVAESGFGHAAMHVWSAAQSGLFEKHAIVLWQQSSAFMHVVHAALSNVRPADPRHVVSLLFGFVLQFVGVIAA